LWQPLTIVFVKPATNRNNSYFKAMHLLKKISLSFGIFGIASLVATAQTIENKSIQSKTLEQKHSDSTNSFKVVPFGAQQFPLELKLNDSSITPSSETSKAVEEISPLFLPRAIPMKIITSTKKNQPFRRNA
jgi:hypothetical protein